MLLEQLDEALPHGARRPENADANLPHRCSLTHPTAAASIEHTYKRSAGGDLPRIAATLNNVLKSDRPRLSMARPFRFPERCDTPMPPSLTVRVRGPRPNLAPGLDSGGLAVGACRGVAAGAPA